MKTKKLVAETPDFAVEEMKVKNVYGAIPQAILTLQATREASNLEWIHQQIAKTLEILMSK